MKLVNDYYFKIRNKFAYYYPAFYYLCDEKKSFVKFALVGSVNGVFSIFLLFLFYDIFAFNLVFATSSSFILSFLLSFFLQKNWTFRDDRPKNSFRQGLIYSFNILIGLNMNAFLMHLFVFNFGLWYLFSQIVVNLIISIYNFLVYRYIIFKKK